MACLWGMIGWEGEREGGGWGMSRDFFWWPIKGICPERAFS